MLTVRLVCVGRMREKHFTAAFEEYRKRLGAFCRFELAEIAEQRLPEEPSGKEMQAALFKEAQEIEKHLPPSAAVVAMCAEGERRSSPGLAEAIRRWQNGGTSRICFIIGGSFGLHESVKARAQLRLSMSEMTFPHHLARVMLAEQIYRAFTILEGTKYHK